MLKLILKYILLILLSLIIAILTIEIGLRSIQGWFFEAPDYLEYDKELGTYPRPFFKQTVGIGAYRNVIQHNSLGLRGPELKTTHKLRIVILGDSYTYGYGAENSGTIPSQLEWFLNVNGINAEVLNLGVGGYGTAQSFLRFQRLSYLKPDFVIYMFCDNDPLDNKEFIEGKKHPPLPKYHRSLIRVILRRYSIALQSYFQRKLLLEKPSPKPKWIFREERQNVGVRSKIDTEEQRLTTEYVNKIAELSDKIGAQFMISYINYCVNIKGHASLSPTTSVFNNLFKDQGYQTISAAERIEAYIQNWEKFRGEIPFMGHFSAFGYKPYAETLGKKIVESYNKKIN
ncbi:SGNH/GDSL hydrolase family protein [candidate division WS5 bacterium]|uniref:SGNH/GDSL hydrolase family protein n=1 Tax=candidate division WS5 bacterium TaxID=2093353 RepID=A0A419DCR1_9BACT|nr:MAG: SGNH/GDSL hydrolase family protein [candidate division WS5 bacterium]